MDQEQRDQEEPKEDPSPPDQDTPGEAAAGDLGGYAALLSDPALWEQVGPILGEFVDGRIGGKLAERDEAMRQEIRSGLGQLGENIGELVDQKVNAQLQAVLSQARPAYQPNGHSGETPPPTAPPANDIPAPAQPSPERSRLLEQALPHLIQGLFGQNRPAQQQPQDQFASFAGLAKTMAETLAAIASPYVEMQNNGYQRAYQEMTVLARLGKNPFEERGDEPD